MNRRQITAIIAATRRGETVPALASRLRVTRQDVERVVSLAHAEAGLRAEMRARLAVAKDAETFEAAKASVKRILADSKKAEPKQWPPPTY